jgi:hypothetical protein
MPRATWKGFLRLSLVTCPVYFVPAATKTRAIRLHQVRVPRREAEPDFDDEEEDNERPLAPSARPAEPVHPFPQTVPPEGLTPRPPPSERPDEPEAIGPAARIALQPIDRDTGELLERHDVRKA